MTQLSQWSCCCCCCCELTSVLSAVPVADIKAVITGKDCPHMKEKGALKQNKVCVHACGQLGVYPGRRMCFCVRESCITWSQLHNFALGNNTISWVSVLGTERRIHQQHCEAINQRIVFLLTHFTQEPPKNVLTYIVWCLNLRVTHQRTLCCALTRMKEPSCLCTWALLLPHSASANLCTPPTELWYIGCWINSL